MSQRVRRAGVWFLLAGLATVVIVLVWGVQTGSCADVEGDGSCGSGPILGTPGAWVVTIGGALLVGDALRRGYREARVRRDPSDLG